MKIIREDTVWSGRIVLKDDVQIAPNATLTIAPGTEIVGYSSKDGWHGIAVAGTLNVQGSETSYVTIRDVIITEINNPTHVPTILIDRAYLAGGSFMASGGNSRGLVHLTNSIIDTPDTSASQPIDLHWVAAGSEVSGNIFRNFEGLSGGGTVSNNVFVAEGDRAAFTGASAHGNTFLGANPISAGSNSQKIDATGNWWGTTSPDRIARLIRDHDDDLGLGEIDWSGFLLAPSPDAPVYGTSRDDRLVGGASVDFLYGEKGSDTLVGGGSGDHLDGGRGRDFLRGGKGNDHFAFVEGDTSRSRSKADVIQDFQRGKDKIDLSFYPEQEWRKMKFWKQEGHAFSGYNDEVAWDIVKVGNKYHTYVMIDTDGDMKADAQIDLIGRFNLTASDFIL